MRITGLASGLDVDQIIKDTMKTYRIKVDKTIQSKDVTEIKQKLYRDIISDAGKFYDKYFDITKSDSILKPSNYQSVVFTSGNESAVQITAGSGAKPGNYTVTGTVAKAAKATVTMDSLDPDKDGKKTITINGKEFEVKGDTPNHIAENLNSQLKEAGMNISVRYTDFAGTSGSNQSGLVLESTVLGKDSTFTIGGTAVEIAAISTSGKDATAAKVTGITMENLKTAGKISIDGKEIDLGFNDIDVDEDRVIKLNKKLEEYKLKAEKDESGNITISSTTLGSSIEDPKISMTGATTTFTKGEDATSGSVTFGKDALNSGTFTIGGRAVKINMPSGTNEEKQKYLNDLFEKNSIGVKAEITDSGITLTSVSKGASSNFGVNKLEGGSMDVDSKTKVMDGIDGKIVITDSKGGVYEHTGNTNSVTLDDITFTFTGEIPAGGVAITGKTDVTKSKDMIVNFINDYNTLIKKMNTITMTKHSKGYDPLTADQKKEMSETEIKLWNEKVEQGQLYKDSNLTRIANSMKQTMRTVMEGSGLNLQKIGIVPSKDYAGVNHGTFTIDEDKLTKALESSTEDVMNLFIGRPETGDTTKPEYTSKTGVAIQLKDTIYKEMKSSASPLAKKVGFEGTSTFTSNELTKNLSNYEKKIKDMEKDLAKKEQALYSKYATLETMMNRLNAQQSQLAAQLGLK